MHLSSLILTATLNWAFEIFSCPESIYPNGKRPQVFGDYLLSIVGSPCLGPFPVSPHPRGRAWPVLVIAFCLRVTARAPPPAPPELVLGLLLEDL